MGRIQICAARILRQPSRHHRYPAPSYRPRYRCRLAAREGTGASQGLAQILRSLGFGTWHRACRKSCAALRVVRPRRGRANLARGYFVAHRETGMGSDPSHTKRSSHVSSVAITMRASILNLIASYSAYARHSPSVSGRDVFIKGRAGAVVAIFVTDAPVHRPRKAALYTSHPCSHS